MIGELCFGPLEQQPVVAVTRWHGGSRTRRESMLSVTSLNYAGGVGYYKNRLVLNPSKVMLGLQGSICLNGAG